MAKTNEKPGKRTKRRRSASIERLLKTFFFITERYSVTTQELADYLEISDVQARRILKSFMETAPLLECKCEARTEGSGYVFYYSFPMQWRKDHKFL